MRKRKKERLYSGQPETVLVGALQTENVTLHVGPFANIDEMIAWCEKHSVQLSVIPLVDPAEDPWLLVGRM